MVVLPGVDPDGCQFRPVQMGLSGCVLSPVGSPRWSETPPQTAAVTAQSQRSRGPRGAGEAAAPGRCGRRRFPGAGRAEKVESREEMPEVTRFFRIVVRMYFRDHTPAHFHAEYGEYEALVEIDTLSILRGELPRRAMALVLEWAALHRQELRADWERARGGTPLESIAPLD